MVFWWGTALYSAKDLTITGPGTLRAIAAGGGIELRSCNLTISNTTVEASSHNSAITGLDNNTEILTINNSTVRAYGELEGSIICLKSLILNDCVISAPEVAAFNENLNGVALNGSIVRFGEVEICPIDGIEDLAADNINIYSKDLTIRIENAQGMTATIINTKGQIVSKGKLNSDAESISIPTAGVYVVSLGAKSKKVVVR